MQLNDQQLSALQMLNDFIDSKEPDDKVFILTGYAGTGKTTIIKEVLNSSTGKYPILLMAPTGKAAKVLRDRTGYDNASTIHTGIFKREPVFISQEENDIETTEVKMSFPVNAKLGKDHAHLCIIDEASMISSKATHSEDIFFGSGILLEDLMTFVGLNSGSKIVFIGDPAQLPPVGDNVSNALNVGWFEAKGYKPKHTELTEVVRQGQESAILRNSLKIRNVISAECRNELQFETAPGEVEEISVERLTDEFVDNWKNGDKGAIITYSNSGAYSYNLTIREKLGYSEEILHKEECLMIVHNNMTDIDNPLFNGDNVEVESVDSEMETFRINVKKRVNEEVKTEEVKLEFVNATIISEEGVRMKRKLLINLLNSNRPALSPNENRALFILLCIMHPGLKNKSEITKIIKNDPYYNALRVKYGYAITCHKAQGSEWGTVYIDYTSRCGLFDDALRWMYTATTRAKERIYGIGLPAISPMSKFTFSSEIKKVSKAPDNFYPKHMEAPETPFHTKETMVQLKMKYWNICEALAEKGFTVSDVECHNWRESYTIDGCRYDTTFNSQGIFKRFTPVTSCNQEILEVLNSTGNTSFNFCYESDKAILKNLHQKMVGICNRHGICITNIAEVTPYCTRYFLITDAYEFGFIDFYHNADGFFTRALASSSLGNDDKKIKKVIGEF